MTDMRHDTRLKLDRQIRLRQMKLVGAGLVVLTAVAVGFLLVDLDRHETITRQAGTVENVQSFAGKGVPVGLEVGVKLDDGRHVTVLAHKTRHPHVGESIDVTEHRHMTGRTTFTLR